MATPDLTKYRWFKYDGREVAFTENRHSEDFELHLHPGNIFGVRKLDHSYWVIHKSSPKVIFKLNPTEISRIGDHAAGWSGKIGKITVKAGVGGLDKKAKTPAPVSKNLYVMPIDSSNLKACVYDKKKKLLYVEFHNGAKWCYEKVTAKEAAEMEVGAGAQGSQGRYFIYRIRDVKPQYRIDDHTPLLEQAQNPAESGTN